MKTADFLLVALWFVIFHMIAVLGYMVISLPMGMYVKGFLIGVLGGSAIVVTIILLIGLDVIG